MADIVTELRAQASNLPQGRYVWTLCGRAADEIERLRKWNADMVAKAAGGGTLDGYREMGAEIARLAAENERLRGVIARAHGEMAALISWPDNPKREDWPLENEADAECLQEAYTALGDELEGSGCAFQSSALRTARLAAEVEGLREALEKIACRHVTKAPLWWQVAARAALERQP